MSKVIGDYRRRHRQWIAENMPTMSETDWAKYERWVAAFGGQHSRAARRVLRSVAGRKLRGKPTMESGALTRLAPDAARMEKWIAFGAYSGRLK